MRCISCKISFKPTAFNQKSCRLNDDCMTFEAMYFLEKKRKADEKAKQSLNEAIKTHKETKGIQAAFISTRMIVHTMVRLRDKGKECISCGVQWNDSFQAGHLYAAGNYISLRYDFYNIHGQCQKCNLMNNGNENEYHLRLPNRIGIEEYNKLKERALEDKKQAKHWTKEQLSQIRKEASNKIKELKQH